MRSRPLPVCHSFPSANLRAGLNVPAVPRDFFDLTPEQQNVIRVSAATLRAEVAQVARQGTAGDLDLCIRRLNQSFLRDLVVTIRTACKLAQNELVWPTLASHFH